LTTTWTALRACLTRRQTLNTLNPHLIVTAVTRTRTTPADSTYLTRQLAQAATTPSTCRQTRIAQLVTDLDPKLAAAALGMQDSGLVRYLADNVDHDRLQRSVPGHSWANPCAAGSTLHTLARTCASWRRSPPPGPGKRPSGSTRCWLMSITVPPAPAISTSTPS
jgi:hypothetical protein